MCESIPAILFVLLAVPSILFLSSAICIGGYALFRAAMNDMKDKDKEDFYARWNAAAKE